MLVGSLPAHRYGLAEDTVREAVFLITEVLVSLRKHFHSDYTLV